MAGLCGCASHGVIIHSRGWLPKVELLQAPNLYLAMQLLNSEIIKKKKKNAKHAQ